MSKSFTALRVARMRIAFQCMAIVALGVVVFNAPESAGGGGRQGRLRRAKPMAAPSLIARSPERGVAAGNGGVAGGSGLDLAYCFEGPAYAAGVIDGQQGWTAFLDEDQQSIPEPQIAAANPREGSQHVRIARVAAQPDGTVIGAFSPNLGAQAPGRYTVSVDVAISGIEGADYYVTAQAPSLNFIAAVVNFHYVSSPAVAGQGDIYVIDDVGKGAEFVNTGANWIAGGYRTLTIIVDALDNSIEYHYDGALIYTSVAGIVAADTVEQVVLYSDNWNLTDVGDFDCLSIEGGPVAPCNADLTGDATVNVSDLLELIGAWGSCVCVADLNDDGVVNVTDLLLLIGHWGPCDA